MKMASTKHIPIMSPILVLLAGKPDFLLWMHDYVRSQALCQPDLTLTWALSLSSCFGVLLVGGEGGSHGGGNGDGFIENSLMDPEDSHWQYRYTRVC